MSNMHSLKIWVKDYRPVLDGVRPFVIVKEDRGFAVDDIVHLREWDHEKGTYTGMAIWRRVTNVVQHGEFGLPEGLVILSLSQSAQLIVKHFCGHNHTYKPNLNGLVTSLSVCPECSRTQFVDAIEGFKIRHWGEE